jgi:hypothetical protein
MSRRLIEGVLLEMLPRWRVIGRLAAKAVIQGQGAGREAVIAKELRPIAARDPAILVGQSPGDDSDRGGVVQHHIEVALVECGDFRVSRGNIRRRSAVDDIELRDHDLEAPIRNLLEEIGEAPVTELPIVFGAEMALEADDVDRRVPAPESVHDVEHCAPATAAIPIVVFQAELGQGEERLPVRLPGRAEGNVQIVGPDLLQEDGLSQAVIAIADLDSLIDHVPGLDATGEVAAHGMDMVPQRSYRGIPVGHLGEPTRCLAMPNKRVDPKLHVMFRSPGIDRVSP